MKSRFRKRDTHSSGREHTREARFTLSDNGQSDLSANIPSPQETQQPHRIVFAFKYLTEAHVGPEVATPQGDGYRPPRI